MEGNRVYQDLAGAEAGFFSSSSRLFPTMFAPSCVSEPTRPPLGA